MKLNFIGSKPFEQGSPRGAALLFLDLLLAVDSDAVLG